MCIYNYEEKVSAILVGPKLNCNEIVLLQYRHITEYFATGDSFSIFDAQVSLSFSHNKAVVGAAVYTNQIGLCSWTGALGGNKPYFNKSSAYRWPFINYR